MPRDPRPAQESILRAAAELPETLQQLRWQAPDWIAFPAGNLGNTSAFGLALVTAWGPTFEHVSDPTWTPHQQFHAFREIFLATVFSIAGILISVGPLRQGKPGSLAIVALLGVGVVGGFWVGLPLTGVGKDEIAPYVNHGLQVATLTAGCLLSRRAGA